MISPLWFIVSVTLCLMLASAAASAFNLRPSGGNRNACIDGIRGYLAIGVTAHHFGAHLERLTVGYWDVPSDIFMKNAGPVAVAIFFMITAYLFYGQLVRSGGNRDWKRLYIGRLARLLPMYLIAMALVFLTVFWMTGFRMQVAPIENLSAMLQWITFTMVDAPPINGYRETDIVIAQAVWTLRYEWLFYLSLPFGAWVILKIPSAERRIALLAVVAILALRLPPLAVFSLQAHVGACFAFGMIAYEVSQRYKLQALSKRVSASAVLALLLAAALLLPLKTNGILQLALTGTAFLLIASGCSLFGLLTSSASRVLGEATYGIYLLHGIALFWYFVVRDVDAGSWSWAVLPLLSLAVTAVSLAGFYLIEKPVIEMAKNRTRANVVSDAAP